MSGAAETDPTITDPDLYRVVFENERVGENIGETESRSIFVELKEPRATAPGAPALGPAGPDRA